MMVSYSQTLGSTCLLILCLNLLSCSEGEREQPSDTAEGQVYVGADSTAKDSVLRFVVGSREVTGPDSLKEIDPRLYNEWLVARHENIKALCPPEYVNASTLPSIAQGYYTVMTNDCRFLGVAVPRDTIVVLFYTGPGQAWDITGMNHSFYLGDTLHTWPPEKFGTPMIKYLLPRWESGEPKHQFLKHGIYALLDHSGDNYHEHSLANIRNGRLNSLSALAASSGVNSDFERQESGMAASFVDFLVYRYGIDKLRALYRSQEPFDQAVEKVMGFPVTDLQSEWFALLEEVVAELEKKESKK